METSGNLSDQPFSTGYGRITLKNCLQNYFHLLKFQGWISDMGIDGPTLVPKSGYFLLIWVKVCPQKLAFS